MVLVKTAFLSSLKIKLIYLNNLTYVLLNDEEFFLIPFGIELIREKSVYFFKFSKDLQLVFNQFLIKFNAWVKLQIMPLMKKLILKGLGLKVRLYKINAERMLELKLGFSHLIHIKIPVNIQVKVNKMILFLSSKNKALLGNFLYYVHNLKKPNAYKGKGIWYKNEIKVLKAVKKT